ncbi:pectinesterase family protein [Vibrio tritonius]|uniref:pectinesterase family protein n=1 Tax=Vibrio tritonius TaxID=1435069 RepID=UPI000837E1AD|nr:pectinesterase family protein [Vibrio tritonius]
MSSLHSNDIPTLTVRQDGKGDYPTIQAALDALVGLDALINSEGVKGKHTLYQINIGPGTYYERLCVTRPNLILQGSSLHDTHIVASTANGMLDPQGRIFATTGSRTVSLDADNITLRDLTIRNDFDFDANQKKRADDPTRLTHTQAVALLIDEHADKIVLSHLGLEGAQDTLFLKSGRTYLHQCLITGHIDFIFGAGTAWFEQCDLTAKARRDTAHNEAWGYVCAPATSITKPYGFIFHRCALLKQLNVPEHSFALGRPWHPTTQFADGQYADPQAVGQAVFIDCVMDNHIYGWDKMSGKGKDGERVWFTPQESRFAEYHSHGYGTENNKEQRPEITEAEREQYTIEHVLDGWFPQISEEAAW